MTRKYLGEGAVLTYVNAGSAISAGDVVEMGDCVGIALVDIASGASGSVQITGEFKSVAKVTGTAWAVGDKLDWDTSTSKFAKGLTPATGDITGCAICAVAAASGDATATIILTNPGTVN